VVRRRTNSIRRGVMTSLRLCGEVRKSVRYAESERVKRCRDTSRGWLQSVGNVWRDTCTPWTRKCSSWDTTWCATQATEGDTAQAGKASWNGTVPGRSQTLAKCVLRKPWAVHHERSPGVSEPIPMRKPLTGDPCAGEPHARFGGMGGRKSLLYPYHGVGAPTWIATACGLAMTRNGCFAISTSLTPRRAS